MSRSQPSTSPLLSPSRRSSWSTRPRMAASRSFSPSEAIAPAAVSGGCEVLLDGGIRSGGDILKAAALGASAVLVGRPVMWGLAADGQNGARQALDLLAVELRDAMGLAGCDSVAAARRLGTRTEALPRRV